MVMDAWYQREMCNGDDFDRYIRVGSAGQNTLLKSACDDDPLLTWMSRFCARLGNSPTLVSPRTQQSRYSEFTDANMSMRPTSFQGAIVQPRMTLFVDCIGIVGGSLMNYRVQNEDCALSISHSYGCSNAVSFVMLNCCDALSSTRTANESSDL